MQQHKGSEAIKALCFGKLCNRLVLHLLSKEKHSREHAFESVQAIVDQFAADLLDQNLKASPNVAAPAPQATAGQAYGAEVKDLLNVTPKAMAQLEYPHLMLDCLYVNPSLHEEKVFKLKTWKEAAAEFAHTPIFGPDETDVCEFSKLNSRKSTKKLMPKRCSQDIALHKVVHTSESFSRQI